MVKNNKVYSRAAFTLVELIFAIFIIGITVISLPIMTQVTQKGIESSIAQEAIFAASAELVGASTYYWDSNSMADENSSHFSRVIDVANDCNATTNLRPGHIYQPFHRRCVDDNTLVAVGGAGGLEDAIDTKTIFIDDGGNDVILGDSVGYKIGYDSNITVNTMANQNIKRITSIISNPNLTTEDKTVVKLYTQNANIGEVDYFKRRF